MKQNRSRKSRDTVPLMWSKVSIDEKCVCALSASFFKHRQDATCLSPSLLSFFFSELVACCCYSSKREIQKRASFPSLMNNNCHRACQQRGRGKRQETVYNYPTDPKQKVQVSLSAFMRTSGTRRKNLTFSGNTKSHQQSQSFAVILWYRKPQHFHIGARALLDI